MLASSTIRALSRAANTASLQAATRSIRPTAATATKQFRAFAQSSSTTAEAGSFDRPIATLDNVLKAKVPDVCATLFEAKKSKRLSFEQIAKAVGREEVAVAAIFYGQAKASEEDVKNLAEILGLDHDQLRVDLYAWPDRGRTVEMPPKEPLVYRLYEIVQNYGYAYKAVINEKFGDGIMSAISFSTTVKKETDDKGQDWVNIHLRGKWLPYTRF